jgi:hypothetical protein
MNYRSLLPVLCSVFAAAVIMPASVVAGEPIPGLDVNLEQHPAGIVAHDTTDASGHVRFSNLKPGTYFVVPVKKQPAFFQALVTNEKTASTLAHTPAPKPAPSLTGRQMSGAKTGLDDWNITARVGQQALDSKIVACADTSLHNGSCIEFTVTQSASGQPIDVVIQEK